MVHIWDPKYYYNEGGKGLEVNESSEPYSSSIVCQQSLPVDYFTYDWATVIVHVECSHAWCMPVNRKNDSLCIVLYSGKFSMVQIFAKTMKWL